MNRSPAMDRAAFFVAAVLFAALVAAPLDAANTWDGGGADNNWGTANNWDNDAVPIFPIGLTFQGTTRLTSNNEAAGRTVNGITFTGTGANAAGAFTLSGSAITLGGNIVVSGNPATATTQTINLDLALNAARQVTTANANSTIVLNGVISGGFQLTKTTNNGGTLVLSNTNNSFSGKLVLGSGTTSVTSIADSGVNSAIGSGSQIDFGGGNSQGGILNFTGGAGGSANRAIAMISAQNSTQTILNNGANGGSGLVFSGNVTHSAGAGFTTTLALGGSNTDANTFQSVLADGASGGTLAVTKSGAGTWALSGANTYTGTTSITQGTLSAPSFGTAGSASPLGAATTVAINGGANAITLNWTGTANESTNKTFAIANTTGGMTFGNLGSGTLTLLNDITFSGIGNKTLTLRSASAPIVVAGSISDGANGTVVSVVRSGGAGGKLWLSGTGSTFSGGVTVGANGQLYVPFVGNAGSASALGTSGTVTLGVGTFQGNLTTTNTADETTTKVFLLNGTGTTSYVGSIVTGSTGRLTVTSALATAGSNPRVLQLSTEAATGGVNFDGLIANGTSTLSVGVRVAGVGGSFRLGNDSNSFTDGVSFLAASGTTTLSVATIGNTGANSALGTSGSITFGSTGGTSLLAYTGAGENSDKTLVVAGAGTAGIVANNTSGLLKFTNNMVVTAAAARGFVLDGSGAGEFAGAIVNGASASVTSLTKTGAGTWTLSGVNTYTGTTSVTGGTLVVDGSITSNVALSGSASLEGRGTVGAISGSGLVGPGNSPGILTAPSVDPTGGLDFAFEFTAAAPDYTNAGASLNDVLWLTGGTPFTSALTGANEVNIYFTPAAVNLGTLTGGFFTTSAVDFLSSISNAAYNYYVQAAGGSVVYKGQSYKTLAEYDPAKTVTVSTVTQNGGQVMQMVVVPEPGALAIAGVGVILAGWRLARRRR